MFSNIFRKGSKDKQLEPTNSNNSNSSNGSRITRRQMSVLSANTLNHLDDLGSALIEITNEVNVLVANFHQAQKEGKPTSSFKFDLAQIESRLNNLQCRGIDNVDTFDLKTGRDKAKLTRKDLNKKSEALSDRIEELFTEIKASETGSQDDPAPQHNPRCDTILDSENDVVMGGTTPNKDYRRNMSVMSGKALDNLGILNQSLTILEEEVGLFEKNLDLLQSQSFMINASQLKNDLAQLEARLDKLQFSGIDSVGTAELKSGKDGAKCERKQLTERATNLSAKIEYLFKRLQK